MGIDARGVLLDGHGESSPEKRAID